MGLILALTLTAVHLSASAALAKEGPQVVASTSWVGAIAEAAGAGAVKVLAPLELRHPPEYDFKPSDVQRALNADYVIYAGYEQFIAKLQAAVVLPQHKLIQVMTTNIPTTLKEETRKLADLFGTQQQQQTWEKEYDAVASKVLAMAAEKGLVGQRAVVHVFLTEFAEWLGLEVVGTFGGGEEVTPVKMADLVRLNPDIVVDNWHNEQGSGIAMAADVPRAVLINFPGHGGTRSLIDVLIYNARQLGIGL
ncbi:MAG: ABC transporter substrate-binding protein [Firmicutes bacterium]|jgi:zinc transport system substrate-binding protein/iron/zinc/copper transport system substrate-binding protein|nr:ABC transporter substrate-binding protein [Bacillota bacterium]